MEALGPLSDEAAGRILTARSLTRDRIDSVVAWAQGSPLALTVATSAPKGQLHEPGSTALEQRLTAWLAGHPFLDVSQEVIEVAALARSVDARLLAAALPGRNTREAFARLVALPVSEQIGGLPSLTAVVTILAGIVGAVIGPWLLTLVGVRDPRARGLALGAVSHGIGTSRALHESPTEGAFSGLSMALSALATSVVVPVVVGWL